MVGSDIYGLKNHIRKRKKSTYEPNVIVVIPAYNEEISITSCVTSVLRSNYPREKLEVIVINDGSTDKTKEILEEYQLKSNARNLKIVTQENSGKAHSLNNGIRNYSHGELVMCLDGDSILSENAIKNAVLYFEKENVMALASNLKIQKGKGILNLIQRFEYAVSYQMKKAQTVFNIEYIIGGVGSIFRRSILEKVRFYDTNTVTEDIDLTMKIINNGNKEFRVIYGSDVVAYTQSALTIKDLIKQRYRWKWGRYQTFLKNKKLFFSFDKKYTKGLSWFYLPFALFTDITFFLEPLMLTYIWLVILGHRDYGSFLVMIAIVTYYLVLNILSEDTFSFKEKLELIIVAPFMYILFYTLSMVEYVALIKSWINMPGLKKSLLSDKQNWKPITRLGFKESV